MKHLRIALVVLACCLAPAAVFAGVAGSDHDLSTTQGLCFACHVPHNAEGAVLWASTPSDNFSGVVADLCYTCHDGSVTGIGSGTAFNATLEQHAAVGSDCSGDGACHDVHNQNPNGTGRFLVVTETNGSYCISCHGATPFTGAEALGDHTAGITHWTDGSTFTCTQCHTPHGATAQTTNPVGLTNPILLADNSAGGYYGAFCISCHDGTAPTTAVLNSGGVAATDVFDYAEALDDGTETKHPTITTDATTPVGGCNRCHTVHDPAGTAYDGFLLMADNANSAYCLSCHSGGSAPAVGANTHYMGIPADVNMNSGLSPAMPWADQIDEDGNAGADYGNATANYMACETCHSVHRQGNQGLNAAYFLRHENGNLNEVCTACHSDN